MGLTSAAVNRDTFNSKLREALSQGEIQVMLTSPEMLENEEFHKILTSKTVSSKLGLIVVDEAHVISQWGGGEKKFREHYARLEKLRSLGAAGIPILATSATLTPLMLAEVRKDLHIDKSESFHLNLGNDRANIRQEVRYMKSATDYDALNFIVEDVHEVADIPRGIVFVNTLSDAHAVAQHLRRKVGPELAEHIGILHAKRSQFAKTDEWARFERGDVRLLVATEAAAMGMDVADIVLVVQLGVPGVLSVWIQRAGRAGRAAGVQARAVLLVEVSVVQKVIRKKKVRKKGQGKQSKEQDVERVEEYKKSTEEAMRKWIETSGCRRVVVDEYFDNPHRSELIEPALCCDNCEANRSVDGMPSHDDDTSSEDEERDDGNEILGHEGIEQADLDDDDLFTQFPELDWDALVYEENNGGGVHSTTESAGPLASQEGARMAPLSPERRGGQHLTDVKNALHQWRLDTRRSKYRHGSLTASSLLPDSILTTVASRRRGVKTASDLRGVLKTTWPFLDAHADDVLGVVSQVDSRYANEKAAKLEAKKAAVEARKQAREAERAATKERKEIEKRAERQKKQAAKQAEKEQREAERLAERNRRVVDSGSPSRPLLDRSPPGSTTSSLHAAYTGPMTYFASPPRNAHSSTTAAVDTTQSPYRYPVTPPMYVYGPRYSPYPPRYPPPWYDGAAGSRAYYTPIPSTSASHTPAPPSHPSPHALPLSAPAMFYHGSPTTTNYLNYTSIPTPRIPSNFPPRPTTPTPPQRDHQPRLAALPVHPPPLPQTPQGPQPQAPRSPTLPPPP